MNKNEAFEKLCSHYKERPTIIGTRSFPKWFGFYVAPPDIKDKNKVLVGPMICVNKITGKVVEEDDVPEGELR